MGVGMRCELPSELYGKFLVGVSMLFVVFEEGILLGVWLGGREWWCWLCHTCFFNAFAKRGYNVLEVVLCFLPLCWGELGVF